jgi:hypothetical protein
MTNQEILDQIAKFEKGLSNPSIPESAKGTIKSKIEALKAQLEKTEEKVEKKEEKLQAEEKKIQSELEENIAKWEKGLNNPNIPASAKEAIKRKIAAAKDEVAKQKAEIKEDVKESAKETKEIKAAVKKLAEVAKKAGKVKTTRKNAAKPKVESKEGEREKKSEKRQSKLKGMMADLEALIHKNKYLASKYEGKHVDLDRDAKRPAKPFGYRFVGKGDYRIPTAEQIKEGKKTGKIDYEGRPNRADKGPKKEYKLRDGGDVDNQNAEMVLSKAKELKHHADELENVVTRGSKVDAWEVAKMERAATDASDVTHYEDGKSGEDDKYDGYMAKGGKLYNEEFGVGKSKYVVNYYDGIKNHKDGSPFYDIKIFKNKVEKDEFVSELVNNGYKQKMAKGGKLVGKQKKLDLNKNGKLDTEDFKMLRGEKMAEGGRFEGTYRVMIGKRKQRILADNMTREEAKDYMKKYNQKHPDAELDLRYNMTEADHKSVSDNIDKAMKKHMEMAYGGMTPGRYYKDNKGGEYRFIGESDGKLLFKDGETVITKTESDFEEEPREKKMFKFFAEGGTVNKMERKAKEGAKKVVKAVSGAGKVSVSDIAKLAKSIRKEGEKWTDAIKRAAAQLKK